LSFTGFFSSWAVNTKNLIAVRFKILTIQKLTEGQQQQDNSSSNNTKQHALRDKLKMDW
jgi:hypothetical protein